MLKFVFLKIARTFEVWNIIRFARKIYLYFISAIPGIEDKETSKNFLFKNIGILSLEKKELTNLN